METLKDLYEDMLDAFGLPIDEHGLVYSHLGDDAYPFIVNGKRMVLPHRELLRQGLPDEAIAFHPLSENVARNAMSPMLKKLRLTANVRLTSVISILMIDLMEIAVDKNAHANLNPTQKKFLQQVPDVDQKTVKAVQNVINKVDPSGPNRLVNIYLKRGGEIRGKKYMRTGIAAFPITKEFNNEEHEIFGVKMRKKDMQAIRNLFYYIVPGANDEMNYSAGNVSTTAPFFDALMGAFGNVAWQLNTITKRFKKVLQDTDSFMINLNWFSELPNLDSYKDLIPVMEGNDGEIAEEAEEDKVSGVNAQSNESSMVEPVPGDDRPKTGSRWIEPLGAKKIADDRGGASSTGPSDEEDWMTFMEKRSQPQYPRFPAVGQPHHPQQPPQQQGFQWGGGFGPPQAGFGPSPAAPHQPPFPAKGSGGPSSGQRGGGGSSSGGTISSV